MKRILHKALYPIFLLSFLFAMTGCVTEEEPEALSLQPGDRSPNFTVSLLDGSVISTSDLEGHKSMLVFFNTSCSDCRAELPIAQEVYDEILSSGSEVQILCIAREQSAESVASYWHENGLTLPVSPQDNREIYNLFATSVIPRIYILSEDLIITRTWSDNPLPSFSEMIDALEY